MSRPKKPPPAPGLVGPLAPYELIRLARRGQATRTRLILAGVVLGVLTLFTVLWFRDWTARDLFTGNSRMMSIAESASFGDSFTLAFLLAQLVTVSLLTPAYTAATIAEEKDRQTLPFLLVSVLRTREIVLGKYLGRMAFVLGILAAGLPILAITTLYGGVSVDFLITSYLVTFSTVVLLGAIGLACGAASPTYRGALARAYGFALLHLAGGCVYPVFSPVGVVVLLRALAGSWSIYALAAGFAAAQLALAGVLVYQACRSVRRLRATLTRPGRSLTRATAVRSPPPDLPVARLIDARPQPIFDDPTPTIRRGNRRRHLSPLPKEFRRPKIGPRDPFDWKERYTTGIKWSRDGEAVRLSSQSIEVASLGVLMLFLTCGTCALPSQQVGAGAGRVEGGAAFLLLTPAVAAGFYAALRAGVTAALSVARERQRNTLDSLLLIPVERRRILWPKCKYALRGMGAGIAASGLIGGYGYSLCLDSVAGVGLSIGMAFAAVAATFWGAWLGLRVPSAPRAVMWLVLPVAAISLAPVSLWASHPTPATMWRAAGAFALLSAALAGTGWLAAEREFERYARD